MTAKGNRGTAIAASIIVHLAVLAVLVLSTPALRLPTARLPPDIALELRPPIPRRPATEASSAPRATATSATPPSPAVAAAAARAPPPAPLSRPSRLVAAPAGNAPSLAGDAGAASGSGANAGNGRDWRVRPEVGDVQGALRAAIGCGHADYLKLTADEQAVCDRKYASLRGAELPHYDAVPPAKRAYYDAVVAAHAKMHAGTPLPFTVAGPGTNFGTTERWAGPPGAHMPGFGCKIPLGVPKGWKPRKGGPPNSIKLGPLPCFITPPSGFLTEEADLPSAVDLPARK